MTIVIPMTGAGRRFLEAGYTEPKPLIRIAGKPMIEYVVRMYPNEQNILFICNNEHLATTDIRNILTGLVSTAKIVGIDKRSWDGPVPDILQVQDRIPNNEPVLISYCDFTVVWDWSHFKLFVKDRGCDGAIVAYKGFHPHHFGPTFYGYLRIDPNGKLLEIKEKEPFTDRRLDEFAAAGSYYFKSGALMKRYLQEAVDHNLRTGKEFFVSLPYNLMVRDGLRAYVYEVPQFIQFGTPHDVRVFEYWAKYFTEHFLR